MQTPSDYDLWANESGDFPDLSQSYRPDMGGFGIAEVCYNIPEFPPTIGNAHCEDIFDVNIPQIPFNGCIDGYTPSPHFDWADENLLLSPQYMTIPFPGTLLSPIDPSNGPVIQPPLLGNNHSSGPPSIPNDALAVASNRHACTYQGCTSTFSRPADRERHVQTKHVKDRLYLCNVVGCAKALRPGYSRYDKLQDHIKSKHAGDVSSSGGSGGATTATVAMAGMGTGYGKH